MKVAIAAMGLLLVACGPSKPKEPTFEDYVSAAKSACKQQIRRSLHDPDSAEFPPADAFTVSNEQGSSKFEVAVNVRAKNGFGALRLTSFTCVINNIEFTADGGLRWRGAAYEG